MTDYLLMLLIIGAAVGFLVWSGKRGWSPGSSCGCGSTVRRQREFDSQEARLRQGQAEKNTRS